MARLEIVIEPERLQERFGCAAQGCPRRATHHVRLRWHGDGKIIRPPDDAEAATCEADALPVAETIWRRWKIRDGLEAQVQVREG